jgi:hypothetical protein
LPFGGVIQQIVPESKSYWPPRVVPPNGASATAPFFLEYPTGFTSYSITPLHVNPVPYLGFFPRFCKPQSSTASMSAGDFSFALA